MRSIAELNVFTITDDHANDEFRHRVRDFLGQYTSELAGRPASPSGFPSDLWREAGRRGFLADGLKSQTSETVSYADLGKVIAEEVVRADLVGFELPLHNDVIMPYIYHLASPAQRDMWLPGLSDGALVGALAVTEETGGSSLDNMKTVGERVPRGWKVNGAKYFVSNATTANFFLTVVRTASGARGLTLMAIAGHDVKVDLIPKIGMHELDNSRVALVDVLVPDESVIGIPGAGLGYLMHHLTSERLVLAVKANASLRVMIAEATDWVLHHRDRLATHQTIRHLIADSYARWQASAALVESCFQAMRYGQLPPSTAASIKLTASRTYFECASQLVDIFGAAGYESTNRAARMFLASKGATLQAGSSAIMLETIWADMNETLRL